MGKIKNMKKILSFVLFVLILFTFFCPSEVFAKQKNYKNTWEYKSYKDISARYVSINKMRNQTKKLSDVDKEVITKYVFGAVRGEDTFLLINSYLRGNIKDYIPAKEITKPLGCRLNYYSEGLKAAIAKVRLPQNTTLYASVDDKAAKNLFKTYNVESVMSKPVSSTNGAVLSEKLTGVKYIDRGFISASYDKNCIPKTKFRLEIKAPKNMQIVLIEDLGEKSKKRAIINLDYKWEVLGVENLYDKDRKTAYYNIIIKSVK